MQCVQRFESIYHREPQDMAFCPYRVCPIGAHSDYQLGKITGLAIDKGIHIAYSPKTNGVVELVSLQFDKRAQWHIKAVPEEKQGDWADHLRGATQALALRHPLRVGISGVIQGTLPIGGLSLSAAVILAFLTALCKVNDITLTPNELILTALSAERDYVGLSIGNLESYEKVQSVYKGGTL